MAIANLELAGSPAGTGNLLPAGRYVLLTATDSGSGTDKATLRLIGGWRGGC